MSTTPLSEVPHTTSLSETTPEPIQNCSAWKTLVFIKSHKTGSTTLQTIVNRFGFFHNLSFVFNKKSSTNGHFYFLPVTADSPENYFLPPLNVSAGDYKKYSDYDMLAVHVRYNRTAMDRFMKKGTKYISIIREPSTQWESAFSQFLFEDAFPNASAIPKKKWITKFLEKPSYYREKLRFKSYERVMGRRWYYAQDSQMYDLGLDTGNAFYNETIINSTIKKLEKEFTLILIMEYFDESLLILKKELCWDYEDIVYVPKNSRESRRNLTDAVRHKIREFNHADVLLYNYFNNTLWKKIKEYGPRFEHDLRYFREINHHIFQQCGNNTLHLETRGKRIVKYKEFSAKKNATLFCQTVAENKKVLFQRIYNRQNVTEKTKGSKPKKVKNTKKTKSKSVAKRELVKKATQVASRLRQRQNVSEHSRLHSLLHRR